MKEVTPEVTIRRLTRYLRCLEFMSENGKKVVLSKELAKTCKISSSLVRRDLSYFGDFGVKGTGYDIEVLKQKIRNILGIDRTRNLIVIGIGNVGRALLNYQFINPGLRIIAGFDKDPHKAGKKINGIPVYHDDKLEDFIKNNNISIAVVAVPRDAVHEVVNRLVNSGVKAILSFALVPMQVPEDVVLSYVEIESELEILSYKLKTRGL